MISEPITWHNESFVTVEFPELLKLSVVTPIYKANDPLMESNYRPISILHWLSKVFEKFIAARIVTLVLYILCYFLPVWFHKGKI